jgi:hypothetical protein
MIGTGSVEAFVTHNGDLEFFELHDILIPLHGLQALLPVLLHTPLPNSGDSVCVAGLLDLRHARLHKGSPEPWPPSRANAHPLERPRARSRGAGHARPCARTHARPRLGPW